MAVSGVRREVDEQDFYQSDNDVNVAVEAEGSVLDIDVGCAEEGEDDDEEVDDDGSDK